MDDNSTKQSLLDKISQLDNRINELEQKEKRMLSKNQSKLSGLLKYSNISQEQKQSLLDDLVIEQKQDITNKPNNVSKKTSKLPEVNF